MSLTQFAMVEELAFLVKDNLLCKHLVLSMEEAFIDFLQGDSSSDVVLDLEPMNSYNRLLIHRLADIFGFDHQSVGEGDNRHLVLERCSETSIPSVLVSDLLWQYDEVQPPTTSHQLLRRNKGSPGLEAETATVQFSLEDREAAYLAARERIFTRYDGETNEPIKQKPRIIPVVAHRMIAHALGHSITSTNQADSLGDTKNYRERPDEVNIQEKEQDDTNLAMETYEATEVLLGPTVNPYRKSKGCDRNGSASLHTERKATSLLTERKVASRPPSKKSTLTGMCEARKSESKRGVCKDNLKEEHAGAAKRMFAHALGLHTSKDGVLSKCSAMKLTE